MKKFLLILIAVVCLFVFAGGSYAWDSSGWDTSKIPYIKKTAAPTVNDHNFGVPYLWVDETNDKFYLLIDNTAGAAIWEEIAVLDGVLEDLDTLGASASDGQFIVATGAGVFAYESGNTARTSLGLGTGDSPTFTSVTGTGNVEGATITTTPNTTTASPTTYANDASIATTNSIMRVAGNGGAVVLDTDPAIANGTYDGQLLIIQGCSDSNTVQIADACNTALSGNVAFTLGVGDILELVWDAGSSIWYERNRSDN